jgi:hypothetical protein
MTIWYNQHQLNLNKVTTALQYKRLIRSGDGALKEKDFKAMQITFHSGRFRKVHASQQLKICKQTLLRHGYYQ